MIDIINHTKEFLKKKHNAIFHTKSDTEVLIQFCIMRESKTLISFANLVKEIHFSTGINAKRCAASIFCGLLEYTKLGKIQLKQEEAFASLELAKVRNGIRG